MHIGAAGRNEALIIRYPGNDPSEIFREVGGHIQATVKQPLVLQAVPQRDEVGGRTLRVHPFSKAVLFIETAELLGVFGT